jgi:hypothetical protein
MVNRTVTVLINKSISKILGPNPIFSSVTKDDQGKTTNIKPCNFQSIFF